MNEEIKKIFSESKNSIHFIRGYGETDSELKAMQIPDLFVEVFARLIIEKCAKIADTEPPNNIGCGYITQTTGMRIKKHFGVDQ